MIRPRFEESTTGVDILEMIMISRAPRRRSGTLIVITIPICFMFSKYNTFLTSRVRAIFTAACSFDRFEIGTYPRVRPHHSPDA